MNNLFTHSSLLVKASILITLSPFTTYAHAEDEDEELLLGLYGDESMISIATGMAQPLSKAPAVASVITANDIALMGVSDLDEVLETVPGLHVSRSNIGYNPIYTFRGIHSGFNPQVLVLINGIPITNLFHGNRGLTWGGMPVEAIERIEVIRGPGSAVYGADAFAGVINIQTKAGKDIEGSSFKVGGGSFNTVDASYIYGGEVGDYEISFMVEHHATDGQDSIIEADAQTALDSLVGVFVPGYENASLAPGPVSLSRDNLDLRFEIRKGNWRLRSGLQQRRDWGMGAGVAEALDPLNRYKSNRLNADITWNDQFMDDNLDVTVQASYFDTKTEVEENLLVFPPGFVNPLPIPGGGFNFVGPYADGFIGNPEVLERHSRANLTLAYSHFEKHSIRAGIGYYLGDLYEVRESKNFGPDPASPDPENPIFLPPTSPVVDVTDTPFVFLREDDRENHFFFIQDIWQLSRDWELTAGVRHDKYSDFGSTTNPRLALVWSTSNKLTTKVLYSEAFRAPSFAETRAINNPVVLGNEDLDPETMKSQEIAFDYRLSDTLGVTLNLFKYQWDDIIGFVPDSGAPTSTAQNSGEREGEGLEYEIDWRPSSDFRLSLNYAFVKTEDQNKGGTRVPFVPHRQLFVKTNWNISDNVYLYSQLNHVMDRVREPGDSRLDPDDDTLVNLALGYTVNKQIKVLAAINNLFDEDAREPSAWANPAANIPNDLPLAERNYRVELKYTF